MNIFVLDTNPEIAASYHVDKHVVKMPLEAAQMLSTAIRANGFDAGYKETHKNHPSAIWVRASKENYLWTVEYMEALLDEYELRYNKIHKIRQDSMRDIFMYYADKNVYNQNGLTPFALAMPDEYKCEDPVESYRNYYRGDKRHIANWKNSQTPFWWY